MSTMKALNVIETTDPNAPPSARVELVEKDVPKPGPGQVLIKVAAASCNPSDLHYLRGEYGIPTSYGLAGGFEATGEVIEAGEGDIGPGLVGMRVACAAGVSKGGQDGAWAQYVVTEATACMPIVADIPNDNAATLIVNPFTAFGLLDRAQELGAKAVIQNAAASQVGKLVIGAAKLRGIPVISTVRRQEQKDRLEALGAEHVLITTDTDFPRQLAAKARELEATVFFDCVGGPDTALVLTCMPLNSTAIVYGRLHKDPTDIYGGQYPVGNLIFAGAKIEGYWLTKDFMKLRVDQILARSAELQELFKSGGLETDIRGHYGFEDYPAALDDYAATMSKGKVILIPND